MKLLPTNSIVIVVAASAMIVTSCKQSVVNPNSPSSSSSPYSLADYRGYGHLVGARWVAAEEFTVKDSVGLVTQSSQQTETLTLTDTTATCPSGLPGSRFQVVTTAPAVPDTSTLFSWIANGQWWVESQAPGNDTQRARILQSPLTRGSTFKSSDTMTVDDVRIDSVDVALTVPAFASPLQHVLKTVQTYRPYASAQNDDYVTAASVTYFAPGYGPVSIMDVWTHTSLADGHLKSTATETWTLVTVSP